MVRDVRMQIDIEAEAARLRSTMDEIGNVNIFLSEGAGMHEIVAQLEAAGEEVPRDPFGHVKLDTINPGQWFAKQFAAQLGAEKVMVQKSGYYSRAAAANAEDLRLIKSMTDLAVECALRGETGVIGHDEEDGDRLKAIFTYTDKSRLTIKHSYFRIRKNLGFTLLIQCI